MTRPDVGGISPFFIVHSVADAFSFYRGGAMIMFKDVGEWTYRARSRSAIH